MLRLISVNQSTYNYLPIYRKNLDELGQNLDKIRSGGLLDDFSLELFTTSSAFHMISTASLSTL